MAVYSVGTRTSVPTAILPCISLYATASVSFSILEVGIFNTTTTACVAALCRLTSQGTVGAGLTEASLSQMSVAASCTAFGGHTAGTPALTDLGYRTSLGAAVGSGLIWTFLPSELEVSPATANGFGVYCPTGTGQVLDVYMKWVE